MPENMSLEDLRKENLDLQEKLSQLQQENDSLYKDNETKTAELERVRTINQEYYLKLRAQNSDQAGENQDDDRAPMTCEEFANTITF